MKKNICGTALLDEIELQGCLLLQYFPDLHIDGVAS